MHATFLKRWFGLGVSITAAVTILLLTQNLMSVSAQSNGKTLVSAQEDQEIIGGETGDGFREQERFLSGQTFPLLEVTGQEISAPEASQSSSLMYVENVGQFDENARFQLRGGQGTVHFTEDAIWITFLEPTTDDVCQSSISQDCDLPTSTEGLEGRQLAIDQKTKPPTVRGVHLKLSFVGANPAPRVIGFNPLPTTVSYLMGNDPDEWRPDVPVYGGIRYEEVYPNIAIEFSGENGIVLPKIITRPGADLTRVAIKVEGGKVLKFEDGLLTLETGIGQFEWPLFVVPGNARTLSEPMISDDIIQNPFTRIVESQLLSSQQKVFENRNLSG